VGGGRSLGTVVRLLALPSCEVLEVDRGARPPLLVPLVSDAVRRVDPRERVIEVDLDFLDEPAGDPPRSEGEAADGR
jgi:ribosomal 30S subunit maturation factor RimM